MAVLKKHGRYRKVETLRKSWAYCSDGKVLVNDGYGWKLFGKIKDDQPYGVAADKHEARIRERHAALPPDLRLCEETILWAFPFLTPRVRFLDVFDRYPDEPERVHETLLEEARWSRSVPTPDLEVIQTLSKLYINASNPERRAS